MSVDIDRIIASLQQRGFLPDELAFDPQAAQVQVDAVLEELAEVAGLTAGHPEAEAAILDAMRRLDAIARRLRRQAQGRAPVDQREASNEAADTVIAAVCLLARLAGPEADAVLARKLAFDESRGWLHSHYTREEFEALHGHQH